MKQYAYRYTFAASASLKEIGTLFDLAMQAAISLFGESRVRLDCRYSKHEPERIFVIDANSEVGRAVAFMFTGFLRDYLGDDAFTVRRASRPAEKAVTP